MKNYSDMQHFSASKEISSAISAHEDNAGTRHTKIPEAKIEKAAHSKSPAVRKRAVFAENFGKKK